MLDAFDLIVLTLSLAAIGTTFGVGTGATGALSTVTLSASAIGGILGGVLADRIGRARTLIFSVAVYSVFTFLSGIASSYEMLMDTTPAEVARAVFWVSWANGVKGYTYGANGIWQVNGREKRYGPSPHGGDYGKIPWEDAMHLPGSTQVSLGTKLLAQYPWQKFEPKPQWASWAPATGASAVKDVPVGEWIWFPEGKPATDAPVAPRFFRRTVELPADA